VSEPPVLAPMLAGGSGVPDRPERYQFEPKLDGQRLIIRVWDGHVDARARSGNPATATYPELAGLADAFGSRATAVVLDGEMVAFDGSGRPDFGTLQRRMHVGRPAADLVAEVPTVLVVFDVLWIGGELLTGLPQSERRRRLEDLALEAPCCQVGPVVQGDPVDLLDGVRRVGIEGLMAKRLDAVYLPGARSDAWRKVKWRRVREFVVGGWAGGERSRRGQIGSLAVGYVDDSVTLDDLLDRPVLHYVGQVGSGLNAAMLAELEPAFAAYGRDESPFLETPPMPVHFVAPLLVVQVAFAEVTRAGTLRHPVLEGLRRDVAPQDVRWDEELTQPAE